MKTPWPTAVTFALPAAFALSLSSCGDAPDRSPEDGIQRRDSAGVEIVDHPFDPWSREPALRIVPEPELQIGVLEGPPRQQLFQVTAARRLADGRIAVLNAGSGELRIYGSSGEFLRSVGGRGEGPGEFTAPSALWTGSRDSVRIFDRGLRRISVLTPELEFARSIDMPGGSPNPTVVRFEADGGFLLADLRLQVAEAGFEVSDVTFVRYGPRGELLDSLPRHRWTEVARTEVRGRVRRRIFGASTTFTHLGQGYAVGEAVEDQVLVYSAGGTPVRVIRWRNPRRDVREEDVRDYVTRAVEGAPEEIRASLRRGLEGWPVADRLPAYALLGSDRAGNLWVGAYRRPRDQGPVTWILFGPRGRFLGPVRVPERLRILDAGADWVLGVYRDELDVERVRLHRIESVAGAGRGGGVGGERGGA